MQDRSGQIIGNYQLVSLLGRGGMGEVWLAQHVLLAEHRAAIKLLHQSLTEPQIERFYQEAEIISRLKHPHIIPIYDFGVDEDGCPYLVMAYAPGGTLRERHPDGTRLSLGQTLDYAQQISQALTYAHAHQIIHRDVKLENILIGAQGELLLSDFSVSVPAHSTQSMVLQEIIGTVAYAAPELFDGEPYPASDQYALGILIYELLSGAPPFDGTPQQIAQQHLTKPPLSLLQQGVPLPSHADAVILRALAKDRHQRFESVQAFVEALDRANQRTTPLTPLPGLQRRPLPRQQALRWRWPIAIAALLVALLLLFGVIFVAGIGISPPVSIPTSHAQQAGNTATTLPTTLLPTAQGSGGQTPSPGTQKTADAQTPTTPSSSPSPMLPPDTSPSATPLSPVLSVTPAQLTYTLQLVSCLLSNPSQTLTIHNNGQSVLNWSASVDQPSLVTLQYTSGTVQPGESEPISVWATCSVRVQASATISISSNGGSQNIPVTITVS
ncbi:MAG TPA: protein kinase [Ktedonobacterales bacterium]|nr:protein kinase [Ktedonobacterales bacterium]